MLGATRECFRVREHRAERQLHMFREPFAGERGSEGKSKIGLIQMTTAAKANGFIKVDTEHRVRRFKKARSVKVGNRLLRGEEERQHVARLLRVGRDGRDRTHVEPPRNESGSWGEYTQNFANR